MADNLAATNGLASHDGDDRSVEISGTEEQREEVFVDFDENEARAVSNQKIQVLEQEKRELVHENDVVKERINKLKEEIKGLESDKAELKREVERSESDKRALESISARAYELETEVSRLQHDLITSVNEGEESGREVVQLRREVEELKKNELKAELFEKERDMLLEMIDKDAVRVRELEGKIDEKEDEIRKMKKLIEDRDLIVAKNGVEMERVKKEREELEGLLRKAERKGKEMEEKVGELRKELEASERMISGLKEKILDGVNGKAAVVVDGDFREHEEKGLMGLKVQWPVVAAAGATGAAIAAVVVLSYVRNVRER